MQTQELIDSLLERLGADEGPQSQLLAKLVQAEIDIVKEFALSDVRERVNRMLESADSDVGYAKGFASNTEDEHEVSRAALALARARGKRKAVQQVLDMLN